MHKLTIDPLLYTQRLVAILVGIIAVTLLRLMLVFICRCTLYKSFYRERPGVANIIVLALEWANFSLSVGFVFARMVKLLIAAGMGIGRIDTPFLAPGVGRIGAVELDNGPLVHLKDILSHEAHRHPLIEQLGTCYLMKLRYASHFGKRAGTCWRLLFVYALMPWLHKYRVLARPEQLTSSDYFASDPEKQFPSLNFVSLHNLDPPHSKDDTQGKAMLVSDANSANSQEEEEEGAGASRERDKARLLELEEENRLLKLALVRVTQHPEESEC